MFQSYLQLFLAKDEPTPEVVESDEAPVEPEPTPASLTSANTTQVATNHSEDQVSAFRTMLGAGNVTVRLFADISRCRRTSSTSRAAGSAVLSTTSTGADPLLHG